MKRQTFLVTRFSYRGTNAFADIGGPSFFRHVDPLDPERLEKRFMLFSMSCLPSVAQQTDADFTWVIIIDRALPERFYDRLKMLTARVSDVRFQVFDPAVDLASLDWIAPHADRDVSHILTMNVDDDDVLPANYVAWVHAAIDKAHARDELPAVKLLAASRIKQWDLMISPLAPLGWSADWHRKDETIAATGLTVCCERRPDADMSVIGIRHVSAKAIFELTGETDDPNVIYWRATPIIAKLVDWPVDQRMTFTEDQVDPVLMLNHSSNDQAGRLWIDKTGMNRRRVTRKTFAEYPLDWAAIYNYKKYFSVVHNGYIARKITSRIPSAWLWRLKRIGQTLERGRRFVSPKSSKSE